MTAAKAKCVDTAVQQFKFPSPTKVELYNYIAHLPTLDDMRQFLATNTDRKTPLHVSVTKRSWLKGWYKPIVYTREGIHEAETRPHVGTRFRHAVNNMTRGYLFSHAPYPEIDPRVEG